MGPGSQNDILAVQPNQLGNSQTRLDCDQKEGSVATTQPGEKIRDREQRADFFPVEKIDLALFVAFIGHGQDPLAMQGMRGLL